MRLTVIGMGVGLLLLVSGVAYGQSQAVPAPPLISSIRGANAEWFGTSPDGTTDTSVKVFVERDVLHKQALTGLSFSKINFQVGTGIQYAGTVPLDKFSVYYLDKHLYAAFLSTQVPVQDPTLTVTALIPLTLIWLCLGDLTSAAETFTDAGVTYVTTHSERTCDMLDGFLDARPVGGPANLLQGVPVISATMYTFTTRSQD